ncbi:hypothetical protein SEA_DIXON_89 [Mycobacterium phage Dixon]|uniref:Uncharacterized protein n=1 Tax=Mycobacterium phage Smeadley TaxID=1673873 RepID=A0A0H4TH85_9CAUD|nr:hypothetical protein AVT31_gp017 [Mycobacterium phage Smeadley]AXQ63595.1 hypothetical protein SEA_DIXON_89 [Mycobacterium phage Dixon]AYD87020.1 hypothetical protein SEA_NEARLYHEADLESS_91 [Mycobacterium phage NearlyHeadless]QBI96682.1 hypothetical protein SEA_EXPELLIARMUS_87 [Mycobacterium phage Expelliarmus]QHB36983.1 hypothetical protein SEA_ROARY_92 [Mycobacterium phage Roary]QJD50194.1 hypothetical protein SEA_DANFORTH_91 [Mycobacterium phage Danforth]
MTATKTPKKRVVHLAAANIPPRRAMTPYTNQRPATNLRRPK